ncbi:hypothetical protein [Mesobacillus harenae]|uniref:hypothetical protein n=1 Tax=Mesobacillus harenae TaxID=2213203 RepID=UPI00158013D4|nr:hypothetical protein [Mesobacillus harenae]
MQSLFGQFPLDLASGYPNAELIRTVPAGFTFRLSECRAYSDSSRWISLQAVRMTGLFGQFLLDLASDCPNDRLIRTVPAGFTFRLSECRAYSDSSCWIYLQAVRMTGLFGQFLLNLASRCPNDRLIRKV